MIGWAIGFPLIGLGLLLEQRFPALMVLAILGGFFSWPGTYLLIQSAFIRCVNLTGKPWRGVFKHRPSVILFVAFAIYFITAVIIFFSIILIFIFKVGLAYKDVFHHFHWRVSTGVAEASIILSALAASDMCREWYVEKRKKDKLPKP